jgi:hypothetical protein
VRILKGFKSFVLEVRILKGLRMHFSEVQILKELRLKAVVCRADGKGEASRAGWCRGEDCERRERDEGLAGLAMRPFGMVA